MREVSPRFGTVAQPNQPADIRLAQKQHSAFSAVLRELAGRIEYLTPAPELPDGAFVDRLAVLLPDIAIIARPAERGRDSEITGVVRALAKHRPVQSIVDPGTLCGGDVLRIGRTILVAESQRTNADGVSQLRDIATPHGYIVRHLPPRERPPLKDTCTFIPPHFVVFNPAWLDAELFPNQVLIPVDQNEPLAASTLTVARTTLVSAAFPKAEQRLRRAGVAIRKIDVSEFERTGRGLVSLALLLESRAGKGDAEPKALKPIQATGVPGVGGHASQAVVHGGLVYDSPQRPFEPASAKTRRMSAEDQTEHALRNVSAVLAAAGSSLARVVRTTVYVADAKHIPDIDAAYARVFGPHRPARSIVVSGALPAGIAVEIEVVAAIGGESEGT